MKKEPTIDFGPIIYEGLSQGLLDGIRMFWPYLLLVLLIEVGVVYFKRRRRRQTRIEKTS